MATIVERARRLIDSHAAAMALFPGLFAGEQPDGDAITAGQDCAREVIRLTEENAALKEEAAAVAARNEAAKERDRLRAEVKARRDQAAADCGLTGAMDAVRAGQSVVVLPRAAGKSMAMATLNIAELQDQLARLRGQLLALRVAGEALLGDWTNVKTRDHLRAVLNAVAQKIALPPTPAVEELAAALRRFADPHNWHRAAGGRWSWSGDDDPWALAGAALLAADRLAGTVPQ